MREIAATPHPVFSLQQSDFNDFLYAPIGEEENGMVITALSVFAREGLDPWDEAARLTALPRDLATQSLTSMISALPNGRWARSAVGLIVAGLIALLPVKRAAVNQVRKTVPGIHPLLVLMASCLILFLANALLSSFMHKTPRPAVERSAGSAADLPQAPIARPE